MTELSRFISAQNPVWDDVCAQLNKGYKTGHWMWFVFPQLAGLGKTDTAIHYAIQSLTQAQHYLDHDILGARLIYATQLVLQHRFPIEDIFNYPDNLKFGSCMTLFSQCQSQTDVFVNALDQFFDGRPDQLTLKLLSR